ncbi:ABC transporter permease [Caballeronia sp. GAWG2-1]|uniref:ABC transporter permease n=1 Tax=Caballeronia sp. GAWG2-1 TaxID=2921744 RepID=UPI0020295C8A|nr:ABC transporter permease [Caballeronia sp. GAWG2-1]
MPVQPVSETGKLTLRAAPRFNFRQLVVTVPPSVFVLAALLLFCVFFRPVLLQLPFQMVIARQAAPLGLAVAAQMIVMRCRSIDLSVGGVFVLTNYVITSAPLNEMSAPVLILGALAVGAVIGLVNGLLITQFRASAVIATLAMASILTGIVLFLSSGSSPGSVPDAVQTLGSAKLGVVPIATVIWLGVLLLLAIPLRFMVFGRLLKAVGSNPVAASLSGLPVEGVFIAAHVAAGVLAAGGGLLLSGYVGVSTTSVGADVVMNSIAGVILGGITFGGGRGGLIGPCAAAFALTLLFNVLNAYGAGESGKLIVQGLAIAGAAILAGLARQTRR